MVHPLHCPSAPHFLLPCIPVAGSLCELWVTLTGYGIPTLYVPRALNGLSACSSSPISLPPSLPWLPIHLLPQGLCTTGLSAGTVCSHTDSVSSGFIQACLPTRPQLLGLVT